jgi:lysyl-tRNA synthetase class 2
MTSKSALIKLRLQCDVLSTRFMAMGHQDFIAKFHIQQAIRDFFKARDFMDVLTPPAVPNPGMEVHIHPFNVEGLGLYLHTSPEFAMKELLSQGLENIFTLNYCFRNEPMSDQHRPQFIMLEWYRSNASYEKIMDDCQELFLFCRDYLIEQKISINPAYQKFEPIRKTVAELFRETIDVEILDYLEVESLRELIQKRFPEVPLPNETLQWDDYYFLLFLNKVEPFLKSYRFLVLYEFPYHLAALSKLKESDKRVCERFEIYAEGIELANCFHELIDLEEQKERFKKQAKLKLELYDYRLPEPEVLYQALERGLPNCSGIALGVERLLKVLTKIENPFWL